MRKSVVLSVAVLALLVAGVSAAPAGAGQPPNIGAVTPRGYVPPLLGPEGLVRVSFEGLRPTGQPLRGGAHFSAATLRDLLIRVEYRDLPPGPHTQQLALYLPDGALYQRFTAEFQAGAAAPPGKGPQAPGRTPVTTRLPVGGTWITQHALYGTWRVEVYLDQARTPAAQRDLVLGP